MISKFNVGLKSLLNQGLSETEFNGDLVYKFKKIRGMANFFDQFRKIIMRYERIGYNLDVMRQSACLVINPITVDGYAALFNCTPVDPSGKHLRTKVTPDFHLTYSKKMGEFWVGIKMIMDNFQYFSIKSYVVDVY